MLTPIYRIEYFLDAIINGTAPPSPVYRIEYFLAKIAGENVAIPDPTYRIEFYLAYLCGEVVEIPDPIYRIEYYLAFLCGLNVELPEPIYRVEFWLWDWCGGGGIEKTITGNPIHITDALAKPVQALSVNLEPVQAGSGDPSPDNIRPISGWTEAKVTRTGKNILPKLVAGTYTANGITATVDSNGLATFSGTAGSTSASLIIPLESQFVYTKNMADNGVYVKLRNSVASTTVSSNFESSGGVSLVDIAFSPANRIYSFARQASVGKTAARVRFWVSSSFSYNGTFQPSIEWDNVATPYEPYQGQTYTIDLDGTRYGGTLDVTTGKLTVDRAFAEFDGSVDEDWSRYEGGSAGAYAMQIGVSGLRYVDNDAIYVISNYLKSISGDATWGNYDAFISSNGANGIKTGVRSITTVDAWREYLADAPLQIVYYLTTPIEVDLTPTEITLFAGTNNLWSDANGNLELTYLADGNASDVEALNILLGNRYVNNHTEDEPTDREALNILLGGNER